MQTGKKINQISNRLRRRCQGNPGNNRDQRCTGEYFKLYFSRISEQICLSEGY